MDIGEGNGGYDHHDDLDEDGFEDSEVSRTEE